METDILIIYIKTEKRLQDVRKKGLMLPIEY